MFAACTLTLLLVLGLRSVIPLVALLTNDGFPFPIGLCDLIGAAHLTEGHAADDEDHDTWTGAILSRGLILVPVAVPSTARAERKQDRIVTDWRANSFLPSSHDIIF